MGRLSKHAVADRMSALEKTVERQGKAIDELKILLHYGSPGRLDSVVEYMENAFRELDHVIQVRYLILRDGTWDVVVIHDMEDGGLALDAICKKSIQIEDALHVDVEPLVLHEDEVLDEHLAGTKLVFSRTDQK